MGREGSWTRQPGWRPPAPGSLGIRGPLPLSTEVSSHLLTQRQSWKHSSKMQPQCGSWAGRLRIPELPGAGGWAGWPSLQHKPHFLWPWRVPGCQSEGPHTRASKGQTFVLHTLETRVRNSGVAGPCSLLLPAPPPQVAPGRVLPMSSSFRGSGRPLACGHIPPLSASPFPWPSPLGVFSSVR